LYLEGNHTALKKSTGSIPGTKFHWGKEMGFYTTEFAESELGKDLRGKERALGKRKIGAPVFYPGWLWITVMRQEATALMRVQRGPFT